MSVSGARLRQLAPREEIDHVFLQEALAGYSQVRDKVSSLLRRGDLIRVKKGLYVFGEELARGSYCRETLANLIYGPSYVSLESALSFHGLIPERVEVVTSVTSKRDKVFETPVGRFTYRYLNPIKYPVGVGIVSVDSNHPVLMATPEKALADRVALIDKGLTLEGQSEVASYLLDQLRLDELALGALDLGLWEEIAGVYRNASVDRVFRYLQQRKS